MKSKFIFAILLPTLALPILDGCSGSGGNSATGPGVRVINGLTTVASATVTAGTQVVASPLLYATLSGTPANPYTIIPTGPQTLSVASTAAPTTLVDTTSVNVQTTQDIDAIAYNPSSPQFLVLYDSIAIPTVPLVRFANASSATGSVDLVLTPTSTVTGTSLGPITLAAGGVSPLQTLGTPSYTTLTAAGAYTLQVFPAGKDTGTPLVNETVTLPSGVAYTFVVLDPSAGHTGPVVLQVQDNQLYDTAP